MLDIQFIRENKDTVAEKSRQKGYEVDLDTLLERDAQRLDLLQTVENLRRQRNENTQIIKQAGGKPDQELIDKGKQIKVELAKREDMLQETEVEWLNLLKKVPNMPLDDVPVGSLEAENVVLREVGEKSAFDFEPKNHAQIAEAKDWIDKERAAKVAGSRFVYLKGDLVLLEFALWQFALHALTDEKLISQLVSENNLNLSTKPFVPVLPPAVAKTEVYDATGRLNKEEQTYKLAEDDLWLNASAEHTMAPMYMNEVVEEKDLPLRFVGYTTAFRREAGTYGKDTEGIFRLHQFNKMEMETFSTPESSLQEHFLMVAVQEHLMQQLKLPYRVINKCTADIGGPNAKGVDIDVWLPSQDAYRETHTADLLTDYQTRRMNTRVRRVDGTIEFSHTNDATAFSERPLVGIIENFQTKDGDVLVPEVLQQYMQGKEII
ncbi:serine--tRNA ligase [soil metagenome]